MRTPRSHRVTPFEDELRAGDTPPKPGRDRRLIRRRQAPKTWRGAIALGLARLAAGVALAAAIAIAVARWAGRPPETGLYVAGGICIVVAVLGGGADPSTPDVRPDARQTHTVRLGWLVAGLALVGLGVLVGSR